MKTRFCISLWCLLAVQPLQQAWADSIVSGMAKAPVVPDGTTAGAQTDFVITLDRSLDPDVMGRVLPQGKSIRIMLPDSFQNARGYPFLRINSAGCELPLSGRECNTGVILQGWPQRPISPPKYELSYDAANNAVVYTALEEVGPAGPDDPGVKQMHLILLGFDNPHAGQYRVKVESDTGLGGSVETGEAQLHIIPKSRPSINLVTAGASDNPGPLSTLYQDTGVGQMAPRNYNFLLWGKRGVPFDNVDLADLGNDSYLLKRGNKTVGHMSIDAPDGATGQMLMSHGPSMVESTIVFGPPSMTARLVVSFMAGDRSGRYTISGRLNGGSSVEMYVDVTD